MKIVNKVLMFVMMMCLWGVLHDIAYPDHATRSTACNKTMFVAFVSALYIITKK